ncbi:probable Probable arabinan endo-1,5-alpha-L-arabinosidase A [Ramularia collo-cygni]|uniref:Arabinan endo-1,5-alpha-L-arabinosidase n=1 Tax=Ramularia collo-cygni TaxID=112498 RepID=A0A2D3VAB2_9PEZI|nr:probable Probable arabinan endo-1,5-alpha-L-arabinosidase A [Ramularia collo-cygni]CZT22390.1 probable Probable arabinan endo-1,5-alpha-L-arabinosidase A [Ramularia collo-cygni]
MLSRYAAVLFGAFTTLVHSYANPGACSGVCTNTHDPSIVKRSDGTYFRFSTSGGIQIHSAPSLTGPWTFKCEMLTGNAKLTVSGNDGSDLWAPDVSLVDGTYYVYYSVSSFGSQNSGIGLASSTTMDCGSFSDRGSVGVASKTGSAYNAIDANLLNDSGTFRLTFGSFWSNIYQVSMKSPPTSASGTAKQISFDPSSTHPEEGAFLVKYGNFYYMFFSRGKCCGYDASRPAAGEEYKIKVCRSSKPDGGFVDKSGVDCLKGGGTVVLESHGNVYGPGGQSVYNDSVNGWVLAYHYVDTTIGYADGDKRFGWNKINWSSGWPVV